MKKKNKKYDEEIDLFQVLKELLNVSTFLWKKKISIIIIAFVSLLIGVGYEYQNQKPNYFKYSLPISLNNSLEFFKLEDLFFKVIIDNLNNEEPNQRDVYTTGKSENIISTMLLERFSQELLDYEEIMRVLKNNPTITDSISELSPINQEKKLFSYAKSLKIEPSKDVKNKYIINFILEDNIDGLNILDQILKLSSNNLKISIIDELNNRLKIKKDFELNKDLKEIEFLSEQNMLAKELNIDEPNIDTTMNELPYIFLKGYKAIEKEINIIKNRKYQHLINIQNDINKFKDMDIRWIDYNLFLADIDPTIKSKPIKMISILIGLVAGCLFVIFSNLSTFIRQAKK